MTKMKLKIKKLFIGIAALVFFVSAVPMALAAATNISALDTVANFETLVKASGLNPNTKISFAVRKPDESVIQLSAVSDTSGNAEATVLDSETRVAGTYHVIARGAETTFQVYPGEMNSEISSLYSNKGFVAGNGADFATVNVRIADDFGNPLEFHEIKLTSNRAGDQIAATSHETDSNGLATFIVSSREPGVTALTATDESAGTVLKNRLKLVFFKAAASSTSVFKAVGGDPETILLAQAGQTAQRFEIENMPATVNLNASVDFTVKAVDASNAVVSSYTGTVLFSSTDPNAQFPNSYTFQAVDQGRKTFDLGLSFRTAGSQKLMVQQEGNALIKGEKAVTVVSAAGPGSGQVRITKPATGTYSVNTLEVAGEASPNSKVKIFDNGQQISEVQANSSGRFSFNTSLLADGQHTFHAESNGVTATPVTVTIDSTPARVESVDVTKTHLAPGESTEIVIRSDADLNSIQATVGDFITDLEADPANPGLYRGTLTAPAQDDEYTINVIITDKVGNVSPATEVGKLRVDSALKPDAPVGFDVPSKVSGVSAQPGNGRITLTWQPAQAASGIALYRIYYGTDPANLNLIVNTQDAKTTWYIPNLQNGTKYYFQVVGVDTQGSEGDNRSDTVNASPSETAGPAGGGGPLVLCDPMPCPPDVSPPPFTPEDGPGVVGVVIASLMGGAVWRRWRKK